MTGVDRLTERFFKLKQKREKALVTYITAGDPNLATTANLVVAMDKAGADIIELGVPFSDPVADGPVIQRASVRALKNGSSLRGILDMVAELSLKVSAPLVLMTYYNPVLQYGLKDFCLQAVEAGVAGVIVPDLPAEEMYELVAFSKPVGLALIPLVAPTTSKERLNKATAEGSGFIYCVTVTGITGTAQNIMGDIARLAEEVGQCSPLPAVAGFGIATPEQASMVAKHCDGVVVGSALVKMVEEKGADSLADVFDFTARLKQALC